MWHLNDTQIQVYSPHLCNRQGVSVCVWVLVSAWNCLVCVCVSVSSPQSCLGLGSSGFLLWDSFVLRLNAVPLLMILAWAWFCRVLQVFSFFLSTFFFGGGGVLIKLGVSSCWIKEEGSISLEERLVIWLFKKRLNILSLALFAIPPTGVERSLTIWTMRCKHKIQELQNVLLYWLDRCQQHA